MKKKFYYLRDYLKCGKVPYACVCIIQDDNGRIARGVSICASADSFTKVIGRGKAYSYAMKAIRNCIPVIKRAPNGARVTNAIANMKGSQSRFDESGIIKPIEGKYAQSAVLSDPTSVCAVSDVIVPLTPFEKGLLDDK